jgi:hypothetical protein
VFKSINPLHDPSQPHVTTSFAVMQAGNANKVGGARAVSRAQLILSPYFNKLICGPPTQRYSPLFQIPSIQLGIPSHIVKTAESCSMISALLLVLLLPWCAAWAYHHIMLPLCLALVSIFSRVAVGNWRVLYSQPACFHRYVCRVPACMRCSMSSMLGSDAMRASGWKVN